MLLLTLSLSAFATTSLPDVSVSWKGDAGQLQVHAPAGEHVAPEAPADVELAWSGGWLNMSTTGLDLADGIDLAGVRGQQLTGTLRMSLCQDGGTLCRLVDTAVSVDVPDAKKGKVMATVGEAAPPEAHDDASPFRVDADVAFREAIERARANDTLLLIDFSAVWCPPCNLMSAEVLHSDDPPDVLERYEVAVLDVDDRTSWTLKDRYAVGGYPTVVVADVEGNEITRTVGYTDRGSFVSWLQAASVREQSDDELVALAPGDVEPARAGEIAWLLVSRNQIDDVGPWLERASSEPDRVPFRKARVVAEPNTDDVHWLALHARGSGLEWLGRLGELTDEDEGRQAALHAVQRELQGADGPAAAELLYIAAGLSEGDEGPLLYGAAASALRTSFTGDPVVDRGWFTFLAEIMGRAGDLDGGIRVLDEAADTFPEEPTWHLTASRLLREADRHEEALAQADLAVDKSWGDNRLRAAMARADALKELGRTEEARGYVQQVLDETPVPEEGMNVRTHRYLKQLRERLDAEG